MTQNQEMYIRRNGNIQNKRSISAFLELCWCLYFSYNSLDSSENLHSPANHQGNTMQKYS